MFNSEYAPFQLIANRKRKLTCLITAVLCFTAFLFIRELYTAASLSSVPNPRLQNTTTSYPDVLPVQEPERASFALIMWSKDSAIEGALLIKSIFMYTTMPVDIHIVCDDSAEETLRARLRLLTKPSHHFRVWFYKPSWQSMLDRIEREGSIFTDHSAGLPGLMKLFLHEIIPSNVTKVAFVDTDAFFISDPALLWDVWKSIKPTTAFIMSSHPDQETPEWNYASRICSCVMLLDLGKLRSMRLMNSKLYSQVDQRPALSPPAFKAKYGEPNPKYNNVRLGDQGYWWAIVDYRPDLFEPLSFDFEVTSCLVDTYLTGLGDDTITEEVELSHQIHLDNTPQAGRAVHPKLLHFNCLHGTPVYMDWEGWKDPNNGLTMRWGPAVSYHSGYKWIWLNQGSQTEQDQKLEMFSIDGPLFADQLAYIHHKHASKHEKSH